MVNFGQLMLLSKTSRVYPFQNGWSEYNDGGILDSMLGFERNNIIQLANYVAGRIQRAFLVNTYRIISPFVLAEGRNDLIDMGHTHVDDHRG